MSSSLPKILEFSVFLSGVFLSVCVSVCLSSGALSPSLSFSLSLKLFLLPVVSETPINSPRNLSEKTSAHENDRRHVLPFRSQTDRQRKESVVHHSSEHENDSFGTLERKEKLCTLSLSPYISTERTRHHHQQRQQHDLPLLCLLLVAQIDDQQHPALLLARCRCRKEGLRKDV